MPSKIQAIPLGTSRSLKFEALGEKFRVLIRLHEAKEQYAATLGMEVDGDLAILCVYEFHGTEPGWHCHLSCDPAKDVPTGIHRGPWIMRIPTGNSHHRRKKFGVSEANALTIAADRFRIRTGGTLL
jgi:hypothetical protein